MARKMVCVIGMHRSGTSALTRCINLLGVSLGPQDEIAMGAPDNPQGFWENVQLTNMNEAILKAFNGCWSAPPYLTGQWCKDDRLATLRTGAQDLLSETFIGEQCCWKDPRSSLTLPFWIDQFPEQPVIVFIRRNPLEIAKSLEQRNGMTKSAALALWSVYTHSAMTNIASLPVIVVDFNELLDEPSSCMTRIKSFLEGQGFRDLEAPSTSVEEFLTPDLMHWRRRERDFFEDSEIPPDQKQLLEILRDLPEQTDEFIVPDLPDRSFVLHHTLILQRDRTPSPQAELEKAKGLQEGMQAQIAELKVAVSMNNNNFSAQEERINRLESELVALRGQPGAAGQGNENNLAGIDSSLVTMSDLIEKLRQLQEEWETIVREQARIRQELESLKHRGSGPVRWISNLAWFSLRGLCLAAPAPTHTRERMKDSFYSVFGRLFPKSPRYRQYLEWQDVLQRRARLDFLPDSSFLRSAGQGPRPYDVFVFPVIDWHFRHQRPQHIALALAAKGHRVFYFTTTFEKRIRSYEPQPNFVAPNVCIVSLPCCGRPPVIYEDALDETQLNTIEFGLEELRNKFDVAATVSIVDHPFWQPVVKRLNNNRIVYDCMDYHGGFSNNNAAILGLEDLLLEDADLTLTTSGRLNKQISSRTDRHLLIRNGTEYDHFCEPPDELALTKTRPIIGYYGAISEWFDTELVAAAARALPECDFVLVGSTFGADLSTLDSIPNIHLTGEVSYQDLPRYLHAFDVCTIPFKVTELTLCTNPVKVYEYLSAGKPVVAVDLPELADMGDVVRTAENHDEFIVQLREALKDTSPEQVERRRVFARKNTWEVRGEVLDEALGSLFPRISIIILTYNQLDFTKACLMSLEKFTDYPDWELILVDNASTDGTPEYLQDYAKDRNHVRLILNDDNKGFAAGNNQGARAATGEYLVFLNNDTYVTRHWLADLLTHFRHDPSLGLLNPVTNNIGNEAKIEIKYANMTEMAEAARGYTETHRGERFSLDAAAFFCVMIPKQVWSEVGLLDEQFGVGFFEDDDYAMRARQVGYSLACAEDVFIHHHLSASFGEVPAAQRQALFEKNRIYFESKWGPWKPHEYRQVIKSNRMRIAVTP